ncbi:hypothetical protein [Corynebacterium lowii]|uniref:Beta-galactosidase n=1 Tax=Corynebacterium lowii TaxID=1544413 RepID=A0A0N8W0E6_9CORY|nr:hypothetical protein [Corynebacterium lowii]KQB86482.1 hypothetical protein Clow_01406 [Corynebacterium lowii]MDP9850966.1 galactose mutarotase-like enzyme [Corynebacterium lowii]
MSAPCFFESSERRPLSEQMIPSGNLEPWNEHCIAMRGRNFDDAFYHPAHRARLLHESGAGVELRSSMDWTQLYTSPQRWLAVEPMTAPPDALNSGVDLTILKPGEVLLAEYSVLKINYVYLKA